MSDPYSALEARYQRLQALYRVGSVIHSTLVPQEADAKTLVTLLHLRNMADKDDTPFSIVSEMLDLRNRELAEATKVNDFIVSEHLVSLMMSQLSENDELFDVFTDVFDQRLEIRSRYLVRSRYAGLYRAVFRGQGVEFAEVREYSEGDDVRLIDWNVSARSQSLYVKRMEEERERRVMLALDTSASLDFGSVSRTKFNLLVEVAALLALSGSYALDRVSLALLRDRVYQYIAPAKGPNHAARLVREMLRFPSRR